MQTYRFDWNDRLCIHVPVLLQDWESYSATEQAAMIGEWEMIRGSIPEQIIAFEKIINKKQGELFEEESFEKCCHLNFEIADYASRINDLHIWYRMNQELESRRHS